MPAPEIDKTIASIRINGGRLCLDFVNTASWAGLEVDREFLRTAQDAVVWGQRQGLTVAAQTADGVDLLTLRALRRCIRALALDHRGCQTEDLVLLNSALHGVRSVAAIRGSARFAIVGEAGTAAAWLTAPVALSAAALLASPERVNIAVCQGEDCHWLFLDTSRGGTRRWCSMASCGNRAKSRAHYEAHRQPHAATRARRRAS